MNEKERKIIERIKGKKSEQKDILDVIGLLVMMRIDIYCCGCDDCQAAGNT